MENPDSVLIIDNLILVSSMTSTLYLAKPTSSTPSLVRNGYQLSTLYLDLIRWKSRKKIEKRPLFVHTKDFTSSFVYPLEFKADLPVSNE
jgi:hypothetical protein